jgi:hypothetical protein
MSKTYTKMAAMVLSLFLLSGCAVHVRDGHHYHYRYRHWRGSSLDQPSQAATQLAFHQEDRYLDERGRL